MISESIGARRAARRPHPTVVIVLLALLAALPVALASGSPNLAAVSESCLHILRFCFAALTEADALLHAAPVLLIGAGLVHASLRRARNGWSAWRAIRLQPRRRPLPGEPFHRVASDHGARSVVRVLVGPAPNPAFTAGLLRPRVYLSQSLQWTLAEDELEAVVLHELAHYRRRDPLRAAAVTFVADTLFWLPLVRVASRRVLARMEFAADDAARRQDGLALASAILKVAQSDRGRPLAAPALAAPGLIERRVERLLGSPFPEGLPPARRRTVYVSTAALAAVWMIAFASAASHAAHLPGAERYCPHHHEHGVLHAGDAIADPGDRLIVS